MREATAIIRTFCIALARVLILVLICLAVSKLIGYGFESATAYVATAIAVDAEMRLALLKDDFDDRDQ